MPAVNSLKPYAYSRAPAKINFSAGDASSLPKKTDPKSQWPDQERLKEILKTSGKRLQTDAAANLLRFHEEQKGICGVGEDPDPKKAKKEIKEWKLHTGSVPIYYFVKNVEDARYLIAITDKVINSCHPGIMGSYLIYKISDDNNLAKVDGKELQEELPENCWFEKDKNGQEVKICEVVAMAGYKRYKNTKLGDDLEKAPYTAFAHSSLKLKESKNK
jgi:hypothetical protein